MCEKNGHLNHTCQQGGKGAYAVRHPGKYQSNSRPRSLLCFGFLLALASVVHPWENDQYVVSLSFRAMLPQKPGSAAIAWPRTYLSKHVPSYLSRAAPQLVSPRERTNLPPFPPISHCCRDLLVGGWPPTIFDTHGNCMVGRRFGGPAGAPCSPGPERLDAHPSPSRSPRNGTPTPDREMHRLRATHPPAYLPPLPRPAALSMAKLTAPSRK